MDPIMKRLSIILTIITFFFTAPAIAITTSDIIKKYGHQTIQDFIRRNRDGFITVEVRKGHLIQKTGSQSGEFITLKSINDDFRRIGISAKQADRMISEYIKQKKAEYVAQERQRFILEQLERKDKEQERVNQENIEKERERRVQHEDAKRAYLKSESYTDKLKRKLSPLSYWQSKVKKYEELIKVTKASLRDSYMEMEKLKLTKDIELRQAANLAKLAGGDPRQASREAFEEYKLSIQNIGENIRTERIILNECYSYLSVATTEIKNIQTSAEAEDFTSIIKKYGKEMAIKMVADEFNKNCPMILDKYTLITKALPFSDRLKYQAVISGIPYDNIKQSLESLKNNIINIGTNTMCSSPDSRSLIDSGLIVEYEYYYEDGTFLFSYGVKKSDCLSIF